MRQVSLHALVLLCAVSLGFPGQKTVGIPPFANNSLADHDAMQPLSQGLADMVSTGLSAAGALKIVERVQLQKVLREIALSQSGLIDESSATQVGKIAGADILLVGSYNLGFDGSIRIDARLVDVETGVTVKAEEVTGSKMRIFDLVSRLNFKLAYNLVPSLDKSEKKIIQAREDASFESLVLYSQGVTAEDNNDNVHAKEYYEKALKQSSHFHAAQNRLAALNSGVSK
jgi:TolB-like protein